MNYKKVKLGDVVRIIDGDRGKNYPNQTQLFQSGDCLFLSAKNFVNNKLVPNPAQFISNEKDTLMGNGKVIMNDLILTTRGTIGLIAKYDKNFPYKKVRINSGMVILRCFKNIIDTNYLFYTLTNQKSQYLIKSLSSGSAQPQIPIKDLRNLEISLPPLSEQHRIANILSSFDNKIELLRKENNTLEDIAQSIFKEWFVKYNFPNKDGKPYRDNNGKMIDSELGLIPEGWRVGKLGEFGKIVCGKTPPKNIPEYFNGKYPFIKIPDMQDMFIVRSEDSLTELGAKQLSGKLLPSGSICVSCIATIGKVSITTQDSFTNQQINTIIPKEGTLEYLYFTLSNMKGYLEQIGNRGSTTFNINTNMFATLDILAPEYNILIIFNQICDKIFKKIASNNKVLLNLIQQKAISLHKLIN